MLQIRSTWRVMCRRLNLVAQTPVAEIDPDEVVDRFMAAGYAKKSGATYRTRARHGKRMYEAWMSGNLERGWRTASSRPSRLACHRSNEGRFRPDA